MLNEKSKEVYAANVTKGFYEDNEALRAVVHNHAPHLLDALEKLFFSQRIALIHSELSEALEANRKSRSVKYFNKKVSIETDTMSDEEFKEFYDIHIKGTEQEEIADTQIRILDLNGNMDLDLDSHVKMKLRYNALRPYKHGKTY